jgi:hypothetical protein
VIAGRDIYDPPLATEVFPGRGMLLGASAQVPLLALAGPGAFDVEAGRNIGPLTSANEAVAQGYNSGILGDLDTGIQTLGNQFNAYLPPVSASISVLFGIGPGINDQGFADTYINPASSVPGIPDFSGQLVSFVQQYQDDQLRRSGLAANAAALPPNQAWQVFETLPDYQQRLLVTSVFLQILNQTGLDYNVASSPYYHQYARGYQAINTLFPAVDGYTANSLSGGVNGASVLVPTGTFDMRGSTVQTRQGGNISILGPGGNILVGPTTRVS